MTTDPEGGEGSGTRLGRSLPLGKTRYPSYRRLGGPQGRSGQVREISPPTGIRFPDRPARGQSLVMVTLPGPHTRLYMPVIIIDFGFMRPQYMREIKNSSWGSQPLFRRSVEKYKVQNNCQLVFDLHQWYLCNKSPGQILQLVKNKSAVNDSRLTFRHLASSI